jgi:hypothetical protein
MERRLALTKHSNGQWCKKIKGRLRYFGTDYEDALRRWYQETRLDELPLSEIARRWLAWKKNLSLSDRTLEGYCWMVSRVENWKASRQSPECVVPGDVEGFLATLGGAWRRRNGLVMLKGIICWGEEMGLCSRPRGMGLWRGPSERELRRSRRGQGTLWTPIEVQSLLRGGSPRGRFMAALGVNLGFGMADMGAPLQSPDGEYLAGPRAKTGVPRLGWMWPETRDLWQQCGGLPIGKPRSGHLFRQWRRHVENCGIDPRGRRHYDLRATLRTWMSEGGDLEASRLVMGHENRGVERFYLRHIAKERVRTLLERVRGALLAPAAGG